MSYILDALKKSEEKRRQDKDTSVLHTPREMSPKIETISQKGRVWIYIFSFSVLLIFVPYFLFSSRTSRIPDEVVPVSKHSAISQPSTKQLAEEIPEKIPELKASKIKVIRTATTQPSEEILQPPPIISESPSETDVKLPEIAINVPYLEELSAEDKSNFPKFNLAGHAYSLNPKLRMILINNSIVREKDIVEKDFILDEITPDGIILRSDDLRFRIDVN